MRCSWSMTLRSVIALAKRRARAASSRNRSAALVVAFSRSSDMRDQRRFADGVPAAREPSPAAGVGAGKSAALARVARRRTKDERDERPATQRHRDAQTQADL